MGEVPLPPLPEVKDHTIFIPKPVENTRPVVMGSLGCHVEGVALPHPDPGDGPTMEAGIRRRFAMKPPKFDRGTMQRFGKFVAGWLKENLVPLDPATDVSFEHWLEQCPYPKWRKEQLRVRWYAADNPFDKIWTMIESFQKDETYVAYKHGRGINSRTDVFKCLAGPYIKAIEKEVYKLHWFIKHVPVAERPQYITNLLQRAGAHYYASDYTSFEALFTKELMKNCECQLYHYMLQNVPGGRKFAKHYSNVLSGKNICDFKHLRVLVDATRMSGEMSTSLGNGFTNLMVALFLCSEKGVTDVEGVVEGDDGLFVGDGEFPNTADFEKLGLVIKMECHDELSEASFCGLVFDPEDQINVTEPLSEVAAFGWCAARYARSRDKVKLLMLRAKSLSMAHQYPGCPILQSLAQYGLRCTRSVRYYMRGFMEKQGSHMNQWEREQVLLAMKDEASLRLIPPPLKTRFLVERLYGVTISQQLSIEEDLDNRETISPIKLPCEVPSDWSHYWDNYVGSVPAELRRELPSQLTATGD